MAQTHERTDATVHPVEHHDHPSMRKYIVIGFWLTVITIVEVVIYLIDSIRPILVPLLFLLAAAKFWIVAAYYMHLKFDSKILTWLFVGGLAIATATITGLWALQNGWGG